METTIDLCACPFCSGNVKITGVRRGNYRREGTNYQALCNSCKARGPLVQDDADEAARLWNAAFAKPAAGEDTNHHVETPLSAQAAADVIHRALSTHLSLGMKSGDFTDPNRLTVVLRWDDKEIASTSFDVVQQREYEG